jgi:hypothetical protein
MHIYFKTRHTVLVILASMVIESLVLVLGSKPLVIYHDSGIVTFAPATPLQILVVGILTLGLCGRSEQFEFPGVRPLGLLRFFNASILVIVGTLGACLVSLLGPAGAPESLTAGTLAPMRAFMGLFGVALIVVAFTDMRLGAICALPVVFVPIAFDMGQFPGGQVVGFMLAEGRSPPAWISAFAILSVGLIAFSVLYSERNSPSSVRRSISDTRSRRRKQASW